MSTHGAHSGSDDRAYDVIVVGSGFGGSITAARLAEAGQRVLILERGPWWVDADVASAPDRRAYPHRGNARCLIRNVRLARGRRSREAVVSAGGLWELHVFDRMLTLTGSGVGGGSLIYAGVHVQPEDDYFEAFPPEITGAEMRPHFESVRHMLRPEPLPGARGRNVVLDRAARETDSGPVEYGDMAVAWGEDPGRATSVVNAAGVEQRTSTMNDSTFIGSPDTSKTTMDLTYIPVALRHGAELRAMSEVTAIGRADGDRYQVCWTDRETGRPWAAAAPRLVLAAGTLNTLRLLFDARRAGTLPNLPASLGSRFAANGDQGTVVWRPRGSAHEIGPPAIPWVRRRDGATHRYLVAQLGMAQFAAFPLPGRLKTALGESVILFGMGRDCENGSIGYDGQHLRTSFSRECSPELFDDMEERVARLAAHYDARGTLTLPGGRGRSPLFTVHPMGGAAIGSTAVDGVVDHTGQIFGYPGLHVADGAQYPTAPGVPPSMTIAALAERQASLIVAGDTDRVTAVKATARAAQSNGRMPGARQGSARSANVEPETV